MEFQVIEIKPKKLIGKSLSMSFIEDKTGQLWASFMPRVKEIANRIGGERISMQRYSDDFMKNPTLPFTKWATVEVTDFSQVSDGFEKIDISGGLYAFFPYKGNVMQAPAFFEKIFNEWIPSSEYELDNSRPHFEILPEGKYDPMDPNSEETIYIPVKLKE